MRSTPRIVRFERKYIVAPGGHWIWVAHTLPNGYGQMDKKYAHRLSYEFYVGEIPSGCVIDHLCRVRNCVNPNHLQAVSQKLNVARGGARTAVARSNSRRGRERTHCPQGHEYTEGNTRVEIKPNGNRTRRCRTCDREKARRRRG